MVNCGGVVVGVDLVRIGVVVKVRRESVLRNDRVLLVRGDLEGMVGCCEVFVVWLGEVCYVMGLCMDIVFVVVISGLW